MVPIKSKAFNNTVIKQKVKNNIKVTYYYVFII